jgi:hypothetical protein
LDDQRTVAVTGLYKNRQYRVKYAPAGEEIVKMSGAELEEKGFKVRMTGKYDSKVYEIELVD